MYTITIQQGDNETDFAKIGKERDAWDFFNEATILYNYKDAIAIFRLYTPQNALIAKKTLEFWRP